MPDKDIAEESELDRTVKISADRIQFKLFVRQTVRYKLDPSKSPAQIDTFSETPSKGQEAGYGIYKVEGDTLTLFVNGAAEPQLRPQEFKTLGRPKDGKFDTGPEKRVGGVMMLTLKKVSEDTTFISEPPPKPKAPAVDEDGPVVAELKQKGFIAEKIEYGKFPGVSVTVPSTLPPDAVKELSGRPRIRIITFKPTRFEDRSHPVTDAAVQALSKLDGLTVLAFESCQNITGAAFRDIGRFPLLTGVSVSSSPVDDSAAEELVKLKMLEQVDLRGTKVTDKSLATLAKIRSLKTVWLADADVTAAGIKLLNALPNLEALFLQGVPAADAALGTLNLPKLEILKLAQSGVTDEGLSKLPVLPALRNIFLSGPGVTDAGLKQLQKQPRLEDVTLYETKVTKAGVEDLKKAKPKLYISGAE